MSYILQARDLTYTYPDGTRALDGVNFFVEKGEIIGLLGANGAGKSTLFLTLNGVLQPEKGKVFLEDKPVSYDRKGIRELRRRIGIVFQDPDDQLFSADVYRDVSFGAANLGLPPEEVRRRVEEAMDRTGITNLKDKPTHTLSHGQKKRVAIAGVLVMGLDVMILDEPTAGLDPKGVSEIMHLLTELKEELQGTILLATHNIDIVPLYCTNTCLMQDGKMVFTGSTEELLSNPELLRDNGLRLPRVAHLMEILKEKDNLEMDKSAATISAARREILKQINGGE